MYHFLYGYKAIARLSRVSLHSAWEVNEYLKVEGTTVKSESLGRNQDCPKHGGLIFHNFYLKKYFLFYIPTPVPPPSPSPTLTSPFPFPIQSSLGRAYLGESTRFGI